MAEFFSLGGYAAYIWPSYILSAILLGALSWHIIKRNRQIKALLKQASDSTLTLPK